MQDDFESTNCVHNDVRALASSRNNNQTFPADERCSEPPVLRDEFYGMDSPSSEQTHKADKGCAHERPGSLASGPQHRVNEVRYRGNEHGSRSGSIDLESVELQRALGVFSESRLEQYFQALEAADKHSSMPAVRAVIDANAPEVENACTEDDEAACIEQFPDAHDIQGAPDSNERAAARDEQLQQDNSWMDQYRREAVQRCVTVGTLCACINDELIQAVLCPARVLQNGLWCIGLVRGCEPGHLRSCSSVQGKQRRGGRFIWVL